MQRKLFQLESLEFGGAKAIGKRKRARPVSPKRPLHVVMKVQTEVTALKSLANRKLCQSEIKKWSNRFGISIIARSVNTTHIHLLLKGQTKRDIQNFLRVLPGQIAQKLQSKGKFWQGILYSRVIEWGRHFKSTVDYIVRNTLEVAGLIAYKRKPPRGGELRPYPVFASEAKQSTQRTPKPNFGNHPDVS